MVLDNRATRERRGPDKATQRRDPDRTIDDDHMRWGLGSLSEIPSEYFPILHCRLSVALFAERDRPEVGGAQTKWSNTLTKNPVTDGTHEDHVRAGQQSHKNAPAASPSKDGQHEPAHGSQGGTHEQHVKAGEQSHKKAPAAADKMDVGAAHHPGGQGGTHEQHVKAGAQSHKNT